MYWILVFTTKKDPQVENVQSVPLSKIKPLTFKEKKSHPELQHYQTQQPHKGLKGLLLSLQATPQNRRWRGLLPSPPPSRHGTPALPPSCTWSPHLCKGHLACLSNPGFQLLLMLPWGLPLFRFQVTVWGTTLGSYGMDSIWVQLSSFLQLVQVRLGFYMCWEDKNQRKRHQLSRILKTKNNKSN